MSSKFCLEIFFVVSGQKNMELKTLMMSKMLSLLSKKMLQKKKKKKRNFPNLKFSHQVIKLRIHPKNSLHSLHKSSPLDKTQKWKMIMIRLREIRMPGLRIFYLEVRIEFCLILAQKSILTHSKGEMKEFTVKNLGKSSIKIKL